MLRSLGPERLDSDSLSCLERRFRLTKLLREFFDSRGFLEVETPLCVSSPGTDIHIAPFAVIDPKTQKPLGYLHTSPELSMKQLIASGFEKIYQVSKVFRADEVSPNHQPEFTMIEWYEVGLEVDGLMDQVEALVREVFSPSKLTDSKPFPRCTVRDLFLEALGIDLKEGPDLLDILRTRGDQAGSWTDAFFRLWVEGVDPLISEYDAVFVVDFPVEVAALAKRKDGDALFSERFELYLSGIEIANGYGELTDPVEQRTRFEKDLEERRRRGDIELPFPFAFVASLERGLPSCSGVSIGVDRLFRARESLGAIDEALAFPWIEDDCEGVGENHGS